MLTPPNQFCTKTLFDVPAEIPEITIMQGRKDIVKYLIRNVAALSRIRKAYATNQNTERLPPAMY